MEKAGRKWGYLKGYVRVKSEKKKKKVSECESTLESECNLMPPFVTACLRRLFRSILF